MKVLVTTWPFCESNEAPIRYLEQRNIDVVTNPKGRRLQPGEINELIGDFDGVIAGTERIDHHAIESATNLKVISRVGIGLDGLDILAARKSGVTITYTPDAPSDSVAQMTIALIMSGIRHIHKANQDMHAGNWHRYFGFGVDDLSFGIWGCGRIGSRVATYLDRLGAREIKIFDIDSRTAFRAPARCELVGERDELFDCDVVSVHVPLTMETHCSIGTKEFDLMRGAKLFVNCSRGGIVDEPALLEALNSGDLEAAALDVFSVEPYVGPLLENEKIILTSHMGSMTRKSREAMEYEAAVDCANSLLGLPLINPIPEAEYQLREAWKEK
jgi:D-3-phosphoglycerate dehydrogenase